MEGMLRDSLEEQVVASAVMAQSVPAECIGGKGGHRDRGIAESMSCCVVKGQSSDHRALPGLLLSRAFTSHECLREALLKLLGCRLETRSCRYGCSRGRKQGLCEKG